MEGIGRKEVTMSRNRSIRFENIIICSCYDAMARIERDEIPLYLDKASMLRDYAKVQVSLEMGKMVQRAFSIVLLAASLQQMKRKKGGMVYCGPYLMHEFCPLFFWVSPSGPLSYHGRG